LTDGCGGFASPSGSGATGYQVCWLRWFIVDADSITGTTTNKQWALDEANGRLNNMFDKHPCFNITSSGATVSTPSYPGCG
jgi:hypothetical protein